MFPIYVFGSLGGAIFIGNLVSEYIQLIRRERQTRELAQLDPIVVRVANPIQRPVPFEPNTECPICYTALNNANTHQGLCGHSVCTECYGRMESRYAYGPDMNKVECPTCRYGPETNPGRLGFGKKKKKL